MSPHSLPSVEGGLVGKVRAKTDTVVANTARFAEAWLDEPNRSFYYYMNPGEFCFVLQFLGIRVWYIFPFTRTKSLALTGNVIKHQIRLGGSAWSNVILCPATCIYIF